MTWKTGTVTQFTSNGSTNGLLQELIDFCAGTMTEEILGTGDGTTLLWTKTLASVPGLGQLRIRFLVAGVEQEVWDNGEGKFEHDYVNYDDSSFDYVTKELVFKTTVAVTNAYVIKAKYASVNANGNDWFVERQTTTKSNTGAEAFSGLLLQEMILKNSGVSYKDFMCVGVRENQYTTTNQYLWNLNLYDEFKSLYENYASPWIGPAQKNGYTTYDSTTKNFTQYQSIALQNSNLKYWFFCNKRRIIVIAKQANGYYTGCYLGGLIRFMEPSEYETPGIVIGSYSGNFNYTSTSQNVLPFSKNFLYLDRLKLYNNYQYYRQDTNYANAIYPAFSKLTTGEIEADKNGNILIFPAHLVSRPSLYERDSCVLGEFDGIYLVQNSDVVSEDTITIDSKEYLVVQNNHRTTYLDYYCVKKE